MGFMDSHGKALCVERARLFMVMVCVQWLNGFILILLWAQSCAHDFNDSECDAVIRAFQRLGMFVSRS